MTQQSEMYKMGWNDYVNDAGCNFPDDMDYLEGWQECQDAMFEIEMEAELELKVELYENEHMYFEV